MRCIRKKMLVTLSVSEESPPLVVIARNEVTKQSRFQNANSNDIESQYSQ